LKFAAIIKLPSRSAPVLPFSMGEGAGGMRGHAQREKGLIGPCYLHPPQVPGTPDRALGGGAGRSGTFPPASHAAARCVTSRKRSARLARALSRNGGFTAYT
jgi:hypothetical protein